METKINLEEILANHIYEELKNKGSEAAARAVANTSAKSGHSKFMINAMMEACEKILALAAENVKVDISMHYPDTARSADIQEVLCDHYHDREWHVTVDKETIINTINQIG